MLKLGAADPFAVVKGKRAFGADRKSADDPEQKCYRSLGANSEKLIEQPSDKT